MGKFEKGQSGNPAGRKAGSRNKASLAVEALLDGEAEKLSRKAVEMAGAAHSCTEARRFLEALPDRKGISDRG